MHWIDVFLNTSCVLNRLFESLRAYAHVCMRMCVYAILTEVLECLNQKDYTSVAPAQG